MLRSTRGNPKVRNEIEAAVTRELKLIQQCGVPSSLGLSNDMIETAD